MWMERPSDHTQDPQGFKPDGVPALKRTWGPTSNQEVVFNWHPLAMGKPVFPSHSRATLSPMPRSSGSVQNKLYKIFCGHFASFCSVWTYFCLIYLLLIYFDFLQFCDLWKFCFVLFLEMRGHKSWMSRERESIWEGLREGKKHEQNILHERKCLKIPADKEIKTVL